MADYRQTKLGYQAEILRLVRVWANHKRYGREANADGILEELYRVGQGCLEDLKTDHQTCVGGRALAYHQAGLCGCSGGEGP